MAHLVHLQHLQHLVHLVHRVLLTTTTSQPRTWRARMVVTITTLITKLATENSRPDANSNAMSAQVSALGQPTQQIAMPNNRCRLDGRRRSGIKMMAMKVTSTAVMGTQPHQAHPMRTGLTESIMCWTKYSSVMFVLCQHHKVPVSVAKMIVVIHRLAFQT